MGRKVLDQGKRLSHSLLFKLQDLAYSQLGMEAWAKGLVPSYITSNPYIAKQYAQAVVAFLRDSTINRKEPVTILDLGGGSGRFCYLFLKSFLPMLEVLGEINFRYVLTDITTETIDFWKNHKQLKPFEKHLDFVLYDHKEEGELLKEKISTENPLILLANYFFDTITQDLFRVREGKLEEGLVTIQVEDKGLSDDDYRLIPDLEFTYVYKEVEDIDAYYPHIPEAGEILRAYTKQLHDAPFLFPIGGIETLQFFEKISDGRFLLLAGDQGVSSLELIQKWGEPKITRHTTFSIAVNYHALGQYFEARGGLKLLSSFPDPVFAVIVGVMGGTDYPETTSVFREIIDAFEPKDYWNLVEFAGEDLSLEFILLVLKLGNWDPVNFHTFFPKIREALPEATESQKTFLATAIERVWDNFYLVGKEEGDFVLNLGVLYFEMQRYKEARLFFERSLEITGEKEQTLVNMGACHLQLHDQPSALKCFSKAKILKSSE